MRNFSEISHMLIVENGQPLFCGLLKKQSGAVTLIERSGFDD